MTFDSWSTAHLVEFLAVLSEQREEHAALRAGVERVLESLDAEVGVLFGGGTVLAAVGLPPGDPHIAALISATPDVDPVHIDGLGVCRAAVVSLHHDADALRLLV